MARKTIRMIEAAHRAETRRMNDIIERERAEHKSRLDELQGYNFSLITQKGEMIMGHAEALAAKDARINDLLHANTTALSDRRSANEKVQQLQAALSDASRVIAALGRRTEA